MDGDTFCGKEILTITTRCYLCGNQKRITPELAAAHQLLRSVHNDYPGSLQIGMPTITALYHSGLLPKKAHEIVRPYIEGNRIEDAIRSEGMQIVCAEEEVDEW